MSENKNNRAIIILAIVAAICVIVVALAVAIFVKNRASRDTSETEISMDIEAEEDQDEKDSGDGQDDQSDEDIEDKEISYTTLVCVPADYMSLRSTAGLGDDVITQLKAGTYLKWDGKTETVDDYEYYHVKVEDSDQEGCRDIEMTQTVQLAAVCIRSVIVIRRHGKQIHHSIMIQMHDF